MTGKETAASGATTLNETQLKFLASMMKNTKSKPDIDWDSVATECGGMTSKSAKERYRILAIKLGWNAKSSSDGETSGPKTPKQQPAGVTKRTGRVGSSVKKGKGKKASVQDEDEEENAGGMVKGEPGVYDGGEA